jgi:NAD(P)H-flavin reductase/hemoglobin-like flavoprotein
MTLSAGDGSPHLEEEFVPPQGTVDSVLDPARRSFFLLEQDADAAMTYFYGQLFAMDAEIRAMFPPAMDLQRMRFFRALAGIASGCGVRGDLAGLVPYLEQLGRAHRKFGVRERHYDAFRRALMATLRRYAAPAWDASTQGAWENAFDRAASIMIDADQRDAEHSPAWWTATVTGAERRGPDLAVLTVDPGQPMGYRPGQHVSVQTPRRPRCWRRYSIANAPRPDGLLRLHVRAVPGGLVSPLLVHEVRPGDPLLLGAPAGTMTVDTRSPRDVLCLAGGTGLAPIKAIIEAIITAPPPGRRREIVLYYGARRRPDLYDLGDLHEMELAYPWLQVIPATSDERARDAMAGTVPELAAQAKVTDREIYISGPDAMIVSAAQVVMGRGAPAHLIRYDLSR